MVSVTIVTWNSEKHLDECFAALAPPGLSRSRGDHCRQRLRGWHARDALKKVESEVARHSTTTRTSASRPGRTRRSAPRVASSILCLNPDVIASPYFVTRLLAAAEKHPEVGTVCGKLLRWQPSGQSGTRPTGSSRARQNIIDSTGIYFTPTMRHLDRGAEEIDRGQYDREQYVFGATRCGGILPAELH